MIIKMAARRREKGTGETAHPTKDGRWRSRYVGSDGRRHAVYGRTRKECAEKRDRIMQDMALGVFVAGPTQNVEQYLVRWLHDVKRHDLRPRSLERYEGLVRLKVIPAIGTQQLAKVTPQHIARLYADLIDAGQSHSSVRYLHAVLRGAFQQAVRWHLIARNPVDAVEQPRKIQVDLRSLTADEAARLLEAIEGDELEALYVLALTTGMRQGELLGLQWSDVDWNASRLRVRHTLSRMGGRWWLGEPKTSKSRRSIDLTEATMAVMRTHRRRQAERLLAIGHRVRDQDLIFTDAAGEPLHGRHVTNRSFYRILEDAALPRIRFHDLRHTAATLMLAGGVNPKIVSEMLGHATVTMTLDTYSHVLPTMQAEAVRKLDIILGRVTG